MKVQKDHLLKPESRTFRPGIAARQNQVKLQKAEEMLREVPQTMQRPCRDHAQTHQTHQTLHQTMHLFLKLD